MKRFVLNTTHQDVSGDLVLVTAGLPHVDTPHHLSLLHIFSLTQPPAW